MFSFEILKWEPVRELRCSVHSVSIKAPPSFILIGLHMQAVHLILKIPSPYYYALPLPSMDRRELLSIIDNIRDKSISYSMFPIMSISPNSRRQYAARC